MYKTGSRRNRQNQKKAICLGYRLDFYCSDLFCMFGTHRAIMKKLLLLTALSFGLGAFAQEKAPELNCYNKWAAKFEERGAEPVKDGMYEDVIVTIRQGSKATCYNGKAEVHSGFVTQFWILLSDGSLEEVKRTWKNASEKNVNVINGISKSMVSVHGELINILWPAMIKAKKAKPTLAPEPTDD
jgi:hypothetical protein